MNQMMQPQPVAAVARGGTLPAGTSVRIGVYKVYIERFLSEGGFAHVYLVRSTSPIPPESEQTLHVLKRLAVPDKVQLQFVRKEVDIMKAVSGNKHIVNFIEASASELPNKSGYEVFILMEYAPGGGIIDMMNTRLQNRLTESEILKIFSDAVEAVAHMHHLNPPLMHRDLKVENILLASPSCYKLCDFGSATTPLAQAAQTIPEIQALEADLNRTTTLQYRAPEMCDVWARKPIGLPADIWALGVFLYKLCYYTTPFEEHGILAIQHVQYKFPSYPAYSPAIRELIASMLQESANARPTITQIHHQVCRLRGTTPSIQQQTSKVRAPSQEENPPLPRRPLKKPSPMPPQSNVDSTSLFTSSASSIPSPQAEALKESIQPMRRGRPAIGNKPEQTLAHSNSGFSDAFSPSAASNGTAKSPYADFEDAFPAIDDFAPSAQSSLDTSNATETAHSPQALVQSPTPTKEGLVASAKSSFDRNNLAEPDAIERSASGFKNLLSPADTGAKLSSKPDRSFVASPRSLDHPRVGPSTSSLSSLAKPDAPVKPANLSLDSSSSRSGGSKRPYLVSEASQTSPVLLEKWWKEKMALEQEEGAGEKSPKPSDIRKAASREQSVDLWSDVQPAPTSNRKPSPLPMTRRDLLDSSPPHSPQTTAEDARAQTADVLSSLRDNVQSSTMLPTPPADYPEQSAEERFPAIPSSQSTGFSSLTKKPTKPTHLRATPSEISESSDEEDSQPEQLDRPNRLSPMPAASMPLSVSPVSSTSTMSTSATSGNFDLNHAVSNIHKFAPPAQADTPTNSMTPKTQSPPPMHAPVPTKTKFAISNLVSRYEQSGFDPSKSPDMSSRQMRPGSNVSSTSQSTSATSPRFSYTPEMTSNASPRQPFKPTRPVSPPSPDESFGGVKNMASRWQQKVAEQSGVRQNSPGSATGDTGVQRSKTIGRGNRQEWKAV